MVGSLKIVHNGHFLVLVRQSPECPSEWVISTSLRVPCKLAEVFRFFADASNLEAITPPWLRFRIITPLPIKMHAGALIDYRLRLAGFPIRWRTEITDWNPPFRFVDSQLRGPYRLWIHEHTFRDVDGGTLVEDRVRYRVPGGRLVNALFVKRALLKIFRYRQEKIAEHFGCGSSVG